MREKLACQIIAYWKNSKLNLNKKLLRWSCVISVTDTLHCRQTAMFNCRYLAMERVTNSKYFLEGNFHCLR